MAFKMKAGKEGPMRKNFPSAFKAMPSYVDGKLVSDIEADNEEKLNVKRMDDAISNAAPDTDPQDIDTNQKVIDRKGQSKTRNIKSKLKGKKPNKQQREELKEADAYSADPANREEQQKAYDLNNPK